VIAPTSREDYKQEANMSLHFLEGGNLDSQLPNFLYVSKDLDHYYVNHAPTAKSEEGMYKVRVLIEKKLTDGDVFKFTDDIRDVVTGDKRNRNEVSILDPEKKALLKQISALFPKVEGEDPNSYNLL
jgi:hypothetical protein